MIELTQGIDARLLLVDSSILDAISSGFELLNWLRTIPNDTDFTASLEMALGRSEMQCPPELWIDGEDGRPGHPNEEMLSMLSSVRS